ncbi:hypothetical protein T484DRAFT_1844985 [Baffinella frigidus]|nr:hypothetical protein T484DRAFT_1844985 [Cryptophyta sp. CCMP2293]
MGDWRANEQTQEETCTQFLGGIADVVEDANAMVGEHTSPALESQPEHEAPCDPAPASAPQIAEQEQRESAPAQTTTAEDDVVQSTLDDEIDDSFLAQIDATCTKVVKSAEELSPHLSPPSGKHSGKASSQHARRTAWA